MKGGALTIVLAIIACLSGCSRGDSLPQAGAAGMTSGSGAAADLGERLYQANCRSCHQQDGHGIPGVYPSLAGSSVLLGDPAVLARWVVEGRRPADRPAGRYPTAMPQFGWMKPAAAAALFTHLRRSFGNDAAPVAESTVAAALESGS